MEYKEFLHKKQYQFKPSGFKVDIESLNPMLFDWQKVLVRWALYKGKCALFEDCVAGETIIYTKTGPRRIDSLTSINNGLKVWSMMPDKSLKLCNASNSWANGIDAIYEVKTSKGFSVRCTKKHRFFTKNGWKHLSECEIGESLLVYDVSHLHSNSECDQSTLFEDDQNSSEKAQDFQSYYLDGRRLCDGQLLSFLNTYQYEIPSQGDAPRLCHPLSRSGDQVPISSHIPSPSIDRPSMPRSFCQASNKAVILESLPLSCDCICTDENNHTLQPIVSEKNHFLKEYEFHQVASEPFAVFPCIDSFFDEIESIKYLRTDTFYDISIPESSNYLANGIVSHNCGLGKTAQQLEWANKVHEHTGGDVLIFAPLAVSQQTVREGKKFGIKVNRCKDQSDVKSGINITNYERLDKFDPRLFIGVVLDESSITKNFTAAFTNKIIDNFGIVPYKLACSATPAPNDYTELGNTAEFLGVMTRPEMLAMYFVNDPSDTTAPWRLKGHVKDNKFWEWLASWCVVLQKPSDLGFSDEGFILPELNITENIIESDGAGWLVEWADGLSEVRQSMKDTMETRCSKVAEIVNNSKDIFCIWCSLNPESKMLSKFITGSVEVCGSDTSEFKEQSFIDFADNKIKALVTKPKIAMWGMNFQNCNNTIITGLSYSYEQFYQLIRRFYRFGQKKPVNVTIVIGERELGVLDSIRRKEKAMSDMFSGMVRYMQKITISELKHTRKKQTEYNPQLEMELPKFLEVA